MQKNCLSCGVIFSKPANKSRKSWEARKYCSVKCSRSVTPWNKGKIYSSELKSRLNLTGLKMGWGFFKGKKRPEITGENNVNWAGRVELPCKGCGKMTLFPPWKINERRKFCSMKCYGLWHRGKNSPVFVGDKAKSKLRTQIMQLPEYVAWRQGIFKRDDFTCVLCKKRGGNLDADHFPEPYWKLRDRLGIKTAEDARKNEEFWKIENGRTLCRRCHRKTDNYGKRPKKDEGRI